MMRERLEILRRLLSEDGSIWISIDDGEAHYLKVLCDEIFGRQNFVTSIVWQKKYGAKSDSKYLSESHDYLLVFAKDKNLVNINRLPRTAEQDLRYKNPDNDPRGVWTSGDLLRNEVRNYAIFPIISSSGKQHFPPQGTSWRFTEEKIEQLIKDNRIWFGKEGKSVPRLKRFLSEVAETVPATTWWEHQNFGHNDEAKKEIKNLFPNYNTVFETPKPERLIKGVIELASSKGDLILDSFAGSGTTGAVAHKMGRRWIMIELGEHCQTHIIPRLQKVIDGTDAGGITQAVDWKGGGGFRYYKLAPSLLERDKWSNWVISKEYNAEMLAEALCKLEGFTYAPSKTEYWQHGKSSERDFLYVTTQTLNTALLEDLSDKVGSDRSLLIFCSAFRANLADFPNLTVKKIPKAIQDRCEFGRDDYSLEITNLPSAPEEPEELPAPVQPEPDPNKPAQLTLFAEDSP